MLVVEANKRWYKEALEVAAAYDEVYDPKCETWGFGCPTGKPPLDLDTFPSDTIASIVAAILAGPVAIGDLFTNDLADMLQGLDPSMIAAVQSGQYFMTVIHNGSDYFAVYVGTSPSLDETTTEFSIRWNLES